MVRRLSPANRKLETKAAKKPCSSQAVPQDGRDVLLASSTLRAMGADLAAIHAADAAAFGQLQNDLDRLADGRLAAAATRTAMAVTAEFEAFRSAG